MLDARKMQKVILMRLSALGDVCNLIPTVQALQQYAPTLQITWLVGQTEYRLLHNLPAIRFIVIDKHSSWQNYHMLRQQLANEQFDALLHMQQSIRASFLTLAIKSEFRIGYDRVRSKDFQYLFTNQKIIPRPRAHVVESYLDFAQLLGVDFSRALKDLHWQLPLESEAINKADKIIMQQKILLISPCANARYRNYRNWHASGYAEVINYVWRQHNIKTILTGGNSLIEKTLIAEILQQTKHLPAEAVINLLGQTDLATLLALIAQAYVVIAPDSGPIHIANALNTPVIGLFATTNPQRAGPYLWQDYVVNCYPQAVKKFLRQEVEEIPWGKRVRHPQAMALITADKVIEQFERIIQWYHSGDRVVEI